MFARKYLGGTSQTISRLTDTAINNELVDLEGPHNVLTLIRLSHGFIITIKGHEYTDKKPGS